MGRPKAKEAEIKVPVRIRLDPELNAWVRDNVGPGKRFGSITHAIETGLSRLRDEV